MSVKVAKTSTAINRLIANRWSPRAFSEREVEFDKLKAIFEAARWAASSSNEQPWRFIIGVKGNGDTWMKLFDCLDEGNKEWSIRAPVICVAVRKLMFTRYKLENRHSSHDVGQALANICIQALDLDLYVHPMAGFSVERVAAAFQIPSTFEPLTMFTLGYLGNPELLSEKNKITELAERKRKDLSEICFSEWEKPISL